MFDSSRAPGREPFSVTLGAGSVIKGSSLIIIVFCSLVLSRCRLRTKWSESAQTLPVLTVQVLHLFTVGWDEGLIGMCVG